jgi:hypothetical protein
MQMQDKAIHHHSHSASVIAGHFAWRKAGAHPFEHGFIFGLRHFRHMILLTE